MTKTWRERAAPIIAAVVARVGRGDQKALRKALRDAYPWGERKNFPYNVWCSECKAQMLGYRPSHLKVSVDPKQRNLF